MAGQELAATPTARRLQALTATALLALSSSPVGADELRVAVASNFAGTMATIAGRFEAASGHAVTLISGSTGKLYAQAVNGAPFDALLAADSSRPRRLEQDGHAVAGSRFTYAIGSLVLWSPQEGMVDPDGKVLSSGGYRFLAIANPDLAPYGRAASEVLESLGLWDAVAMKLVRGENIGQAYQFVRSGNAPMGLVAAAQLAQDANRSGGSKWAVPAELHSPIEQQAVLLSDTAAGRELLEFLRGETALRLIRESGYLRP